MGDVGEVSAESQFGFDAENLRTVAKWRALRAQQLKNWAEHEAATMWDHLPDGSAELDLTPFEEMKFLEEGLLARAVPYTVLGARELLRVALTILAHAEEAPEGTMSQGPILEIVRNVIEALEHVPGGTRLRADPKPTPALAA